MNVTNERKPSLTINGPMRRDGKFPVTVSYPGAPNMFGGFEYSRPSNYLWTADKIRDFAQPYVDLINAHYLG